MGRVFGVDGLPRADGGLGEAAGLGDAGLPLAGAGDDGRLDKGLGLEGWRGFGFFLEVDNTISETLLNTLQCVFFQTQVEVIKNDLFFQ